MIRVFRLSVLLLLAFAGVATRAAGQVARDVGAAYGWGGSCTATPGATVQLSPQRWFSGVAVQLPLQRP
jgi:hypothetical protein